MDDETRRIVDATMIGEAIESFSLAVFVSDGSLGFLAVNEAAADLAGRSRGDLLAGGVAAVAALPRQRLARAAAEVERGGFRIGEGAIRRGDGSTVDVVHVTIAGRIGPLPVLVSFVQPRDGSPLGGLYAAVRGESAR